MASEIEKEAEAAGLVRISKDHGHTWKWGKPDRDGFPGNDDDGWQWSEWCLDPAEALAKLRAAPKRKRP